MGTKQSVCLDHLPILYYVTETRLCPDIQVLQFWTQVAESTRTESLRLYKQNAETQNKSFCLDNWKRKVTHNAEIVSSLVGAFSPVNHKGLLQGWTQTSIYLQVIHFTSNHTSSHVFWAYLYSAGTQYGNLHPAGWPILFCRPTQEPMSATANTGKIRRGFGKMQVNGPEG